MPCTHKKLIAKNLPDEDDRTNRKTKAQQILLVVIVYVLVKILACSALLPADADLYIDVCHPPPEFRSYYTVVTKSRDGTEIETGHPVPLLKCGTKIVLSNTQTRCYLLISMLLHFSCDRLGLYAPRPNRQTQRITAKQRACYEPAL